MCFLPCEKKSIQKKFNSVTYCESKLISASQKRERKPQQLFDSYQALLVSQWPNAAAVMA